MSISRLMDRPIAFQRTYVRLGVGVTGALMLSQAVYWSTRTGNDGWFYKDRDEWEEETGLTRREQETARARLKKEGFLIEERRGLPCRLYFKVDHDALDEALMALDAPRPTSRAECAQQEGTNEPDRQGGMRPSSTEITTETTSESSDQAPDGDLLTQDDEEPPPAPKRSTPLPKNFEPNETCKAKARDLDVPLEMELEKFQDFNLAKGKKYIDWQAAFRNWITKAAEFRDQRGGRVADIYEHRQHVRGDSPSSDPYDCGGNAYVPEPPKESYREYLARVAAEGRS